MLRSMSLNMDEGLSFQEIGGQNLRDRLGLPSLAVRAHAYVGYVQLPLS